MNALRKHPLVIALATVLFAEFALMVGVTGFLVFELSTAPAASLASALFLTFLSAVATVWIGFTAVHVLRGSPWVRGSTITWQVLQVAVAIGAFQGVFARPDIGWLLLVPALVAVALLFTRPVMAATTRE